MPVMSPTPNTLQNAIKHLQHFKVLCVAIPNPTYPNAPISSTQPACSSPRSRLPKTPHPISHTLCRNWTPNLAHTRCRRRHQELRRRSGWLLGMRVRCRLCLRRRKRRDPHNGGRQSWRFVGTQQSWIGAFGRGERWGGGPVNNGLSATGCGRVKNRRMRSRKKWHGKLCGRLIYLAF